MPGKKALPKLSAKRNRMYEHIKAAELKRGKSLKSAKPIAAATTNKQASKKKRR